MSNVLEEMKTRRSIRKFKPDAIPQEILDKIIEAGTYAANGRGAQNVIIIQVTDKEKRDEIAKKNAEIMGSEGWDPESPDQWKSVYDGRTGGPPGG